MRPCCNLFVTDFICDWLAITETVATSSAHIWKWAAMWQKPTNRPVCPAKTQISLGILPVCSESSLCAQWVAKGPSFHHEESEDSDQTERMPRLIWVFAGRTSHFYTPPHKKWRGIMLYPPNFECPSICPSALRLCALSLVPFDLFSSNFAYTLVLGRSGMGLQVG